MLWERTVGDAEVATVPTNNPPSRKSLLHDGRWRLESNRLKNVYEKKTEILDAVRTVEDESKFRQKSPLHS